MTPPILTKLDVPKVRRLIRLGKRSTQIAESLRVSDSTLTRFKRRFGIKENNRRASRANQGITLTLEAT